MLARLWSPTLLLTECASLGVSFNFSEPQFSQLYASEKIITMNVVIVDMFFKNTA